MQKSLSGCWVHARWLNPGHSGAASRLLELLQRLEHALRERGGGLLQCFGLDGGRILFIDKTVHRGSGPAVHLDLETFEGSSDVTLFREGMDRWMAAIPFNMPVGIALEKLVSSMEQAWVLHPTDANSGDRNPLMPGSFEEAVSQGDHRPGVEAFASVLWPFSHPASSIQEVDHVLRGYRSSVMGLPQQTYLHWNLRRETRGMVLELWAEHPIFLQSIPRLLKAVGTEPAEFIPRLLPEPVGNGLDAHYGRITFDRLPICEQPGSGSVVRTELLKGDMVWVLAVDPDSGWLLVHGPDGYWGWMIPGGLEWMSSDEFHAGEGLPRSESIKALILEEMQDCSGARYVWGGRSLDGLDCSGFVQRVFARAGLHLPRDARQQAQCGCLVGTPWDRNGLVFGDLLFFLGPSGAITHTAIALGKKEYIHLSPPGYKLQAWEAPGAQGGSDLASSFIWAKRVFSG